jgi:hypothetical protein
MDNELCDADHFGTWWSPIALKLRSGFRYRMRERAMTATLEFLSRLTDRLFERQMDRAARKISARQLFFPH